MLQTHDQAVYTKMSLKDKMYNAGDKIYFASDKWNKESIHWHECT